MHALVNMALRAGRRASQIIVRAMDRIDTLNVVEKDRNDFVSDVDRDAEDAIVEVLHKAYPDHGILGEERGESFAGAEYTWIIDPLDGTTNYLHGVPHFAVSIGLKYRNRLEHAVVIDPVRNEEFIASRGAGAQLNGKRIRVSSRNRLEDALLATGIPFRDVAQHLDAYMAMLSGFTRQCRGIRRAGSAALDLAYVAAGRYDGYWELGLKPWDMAAGALLVWEAGGFVSDVVGGERFMDTGNIVTGNPKVFKAMLQNIRPTLTPALAQG
jgi:myo-inositol-1(or 4)-monophosphatase